MTPDEGFAEMGRLGWSLQMHLREEREADGAWVVCRLLDVLHGLSGRGAACRIPADTDLSPAGVQALCGESADLVVRLRRQGMPYGGAVVGRLADAVRSLSESVDADAREGKTP